MGTALPFILAGTKILEGIQGYQQNNAMAKAYQRQAEANVQNEQNRLAIEKTQLSRRQQQFAGTQRTAAAASGATLDSFDPLFEDTATQSMVDMALLEYDSKLNQENIRYTGAMQSAESKMRAKSALLSGVSGAGQGYMAGMDHNRSINANRTATTANKRAGI